MTDEIFKEKIAAQISDLVSDFLYYDRKEDEDLPRGVIEQRVKDGDITIDDMVEYFRTSLEDGIEE